MGFDRRFERGLLWRLALLFTVGFLAIWAFQREGAYATRILLGLITFALFADVWLYLRRTNLAVSRFIESIRFDDFSQRFALGKGAEFETLGEALDGAMRELGRKRAEAKEESRFLGAVVDDAPAALLTIDSDDRVTLLNKAARREFAIHDGVQLAGFSLYGAEFVAAMGQKAAGRRVTRLMKDGVAQRAIVETVRLERLGSALRIVSVLPVQNVLGAAELAAQSDLVRVLTHEIMNSLTPVTSLVRSASDMLADPHANMADVREAVETAARRAEGMQRFVESYRSFARVPEIRRRRFPAQPWAEEIARLCAANPATADVKIVLDIQAGVSLNADPDLLAQVCLNLLRNGATAARAHTGTPEVTLKIHSLNDAVARIDISDNGPGIEPDRREDIFLPFYTTRIDGNGVGLSFARKVVVAHGGSISADQHVSGGAVIRIIL
jgi:two-component system, NtrC family, nitrogen regulation sensor histidine kinase NtrY